MNLQAGMTAYLKTPYRGYTAIVLIEKRHYVWLVEICGAGLQIELYEDEFEI
jgi:hypothetical protein